MGFGVGGGMDERNEDHKWVWDEFLRLDEELNAIRAKFLTEEEINKMETKNLKKVSPRHHEDQEVEDHAKSDKIC